MRLVVVSLVAALALSNAAFAQSPAANPSGSVGNSPKQPANAVETRAKGGGAQVRTGAGPQQKSRRDVNVNVRMRSGNDVAVHRRTRHRVIVSEGPYAHFDPDQRAVTARSKCKGSHESAGRHYWRWQQFSRSDQGKPIWPRRGKSTAVAASIRAAACGRRSCVTETRVD